MNMNKREKLLIILLAAVIILLGGFKLLIEPQLKSLAVVNADFLKAVSDKKQADDNVVKEESIDKENKELVKKIEDSSKSFFPELKNDKVQLFFQQLADKSEIKYDSFIMADKVATQITEIKSLDTGITYPVKDAANKIISIEKGEPEKDSNTSSTSDNSTAANTSKETKAAEKKQPTDLVEMISVTMQFKGTYEQALALIDGIAKSERTIRITSINMATDDKGILTTSISAECFGVVKISDYDELSKNTLTSPKGKINPFQK